MVKLKQIFFFFLLQVLSDFHKLISFQAETSFTIWYISTKQWYPAFMQFVTFMNWLYYICIIFNNNAFHYDCN